MELHSCGLVGSMCAVIFSISRKLSCESFCGGRDDSGSISSVGLAYCAILGFFVDFAYFLRPDFLVFVFSPVFAPDWADTSNNEAFIASAEGLWSMVEVALEG